MRPSHPQRSPVRDSSLTSSRVDRAEGSSSDGSTARALLAHRARWAWLVAAAGVLVYALLSVAGHEPFHPGGPNGFFDLKVYRGAAKLLLDGGIIYGRPIHLWAPFTYPPFAAVVLVPLALLPIGADEIIMTVLSVAALAITLWLAVGLAESTTDRTKRRRDALAPIALAAAAGLWLEPVTTALDYGQIELLLGLLIVADLSRPNSARTKGALIGIAAGLKLTPLIFVPYLLFSHRSRAALVVMGTFAATVAVSFAVVPDDAWRYWTGLFFDSQAAGVGATPANQSLRGAIIGIAPAAPAAPLAVLSVLVGAVGVALAASASRNGDEGMGFSLCALTGLLVSPISWTHHWVLAVPALLIFIVRAIQRRSPLRLLVGAGMASLGYAYLPEIVAEHYPHNLLVPILWQPASTCYLLIGVATLALACWRWRSGVRSAPADQPGLHGSQIDAVRTEGLRA